MADPPPSPDADDGTAEPDPGSPEHPGMPRWVKVSGVVVGVLILLAVVAMFIGGGQHGPGRHAPGGHSETGVRTDARRA